MLKKTSITVDPALWKRVQEAAVSWARKEGLPEQKMTAKWVGRALRRAVTEELGEGQVNAS